MKNINTALLDKSRTSIFIAHRLKTIVESGLFCFLFCFPCSFNTPSPYTDLIIVLNEGRVVEQGSHDDLMKMKGLYYSMWQRQALVEGEEVPV
jgi:ATP-binding cassette, subfamily B (MDR/TAP), member 7